MPESAAPAAQPVERVATLGVVSFLNALPLYAGLEGRTDVRIRPAVPSRLHAMLLASATDVALLPVVDYWRDRHRLQIVSDGCIASRGETMTVRVFSRVPPDQITRLHVDGDSHTSLALAQLLWLELYGRRLELQPWPGRPLPEIEAVLLIGDKVVRDAPRGFGFEVDLGAAWRHLTGLPFVFAVWCGHVDHDHTTLAETLRQARDIGVAQAATIAERYAARHGWPTPLAVTYLRDTMCYTLTSEMGRAVEHFFNLATRYGLLP